MKHVIIGTAGHVDHGKTLLIKALTGIDTDRLAEEKSAVSPSNSALPISIGRMARRRALWTCRDTNASLRTCSPVRAG